MKLSLKVESIKPMKNWLIIKPFLNAVESIDFNGTKLWVDGSFEREKNACTTGEVIAVCDDMYFAKENFKGADEKSLRFGTTIEAKPKDKIYFHYLAVENASRAKRMFKGEDGETYMFMKYDEAFCSKRGEEIVMLNGWVLMEPIALDKKFESKILDLSFANKGHSLTYAKVGHAGSRNNGYLENRRVNDFTEPLNVGDVVVYEKYSDIKLQQELHSDLDGNKVFYRMQRKDMVAVVNDIEAFTINS
jgi:co-chaperonin GroES (HSP10)